MHNIAVVFASLLFAVLAAGLGRRMQRVGGGFSASKIMAGLWYGLLWFLLVAASDPRIWLKVKSGYPGDSFHTVTLFQGIGLFFLSAVLIALLIYVVGNVDRRIRQRFQNSGPVGPFVAVLGALSFALIAFALAYSLLPQIYYLYYFAFWPNLEFQWVLRPLHDLAQIPSLLFLKASLPLSGDGAAMALHALLLLPLRNVAVGGVALWLGMLLLAVARAFLILLPQLFPLN